MMRAIVMAALAAVSVLVGDGCDAPAPDATADLFACQAPTESARLEVEPCPGVAAAICHWKDGARNLDYIVACVTPSGLTCVDSCEVCP